MYQETANRVNRARGGLYIVPHPPSFLEEDRFICFLGRGVGVLLAADPVK
jgi:hypothetical protein